MAKVLVVDDEKLIVKGIRFSLEQDGFEVACAYDGEEALQMAKEMEYDMVLLDVMLPKLNGFEVCQAIREFSVITFLNHSRRYSFRSSNNVRISPLFPFFQFPVDKKEKPVYDKRRNRGKYDLRDNDGDQIMPKIQTIPYQEPEYIDVQVID